jgi:vancomycin resistance protein YoaR
MPVLGKKYLLICLILSIQTVVSVFTGMALASSPRKDTIFPGVFIGDLDVGGMSKGEAIRFLEKNAFINVQSAKVVLKYGDREWVFSKNQMGFKCDLNATVDKVLEEGRQDSFIANSLLMFRVKFQKPRIEFIYSVDEAVLQKELEKIASEINVFPRNATIIQIDGKKLFIISEIFGITFDMNENMRKTRKALAKMQDTQVDIAVSSVKPAVVSNDLKPVKDILGIGITDYSDADPERKKNIEFAVKAMDDKLVNPGEIFSFNSIVGVLLPEKGYLETPKVVKGRQTTAKGGGASQAATTLYQAALYSGLSIEERYAHMSPPDYIATGQDAVVTFGALDFKFKNTSNNPIFINTNVNNNRIVVNILGVAKDGETIQVITEKLLGYQQNGPNLHARVYRIFYEKGVEKDKEMISEDNYTVNAVYAANNVKIQSGGNLGI